MDAAVARSFEKRSARERFAHLSRRVSIDLFAVTDTPPGLDLMLTHRHRIIELCAVEGAAFALTENGVCAAYCMRTGRRLCVLNKDHTEVIRSLFHSKVASSLITVSVFAADGYACLRCHESQIAQLKRGVTD